MTSEHTVIHIESRAKNSKGAICRLRKTGVVPGILYRNGTSSQINISVANLPKGHTRAALVKLVLDGSEKLALMREVQVDPLTDKPIHFDFQEVTQDDVVNVDVPLQFAPITREQEKEGTFSIRVRSLKVRTKVSQLPQFIEVDTSKLKGGESVQLFDVALPANVKVITGKGKNVALASIVKI